MNNKQKQLLVIVGVVCLGVLIFFIPRVPSGKEVSKLNKADVKIAEALKLVETSPNPMEGIMLLREVLEEDSTNIKAQWNMALLSNRSGQYEKVLSRVDKVIALDYEHNYPEAFILGADAAEQLNLTDKALSLLNDYRDAVSEDSERERKFIDQRIKKLNELNKN